MPMPDVELSADHKRAVKQRESPERIENDFPRMSIRDRRVNRQHQQKQERQRRFVKKCEREKRAKPDNAPLVIEKRGAVDLVFADIRDSVEECLRQQMMRASKAH